VTTIDLPLGFRNCGLISSFSVWVQTCYSCVSCLNYSLASVWFRSGKDSNCWHIPLH